MADKEKEPLEDENPQDPNITKTDITDEMQTAYLDYAMSVIVSRALPDVRDGLKPVHRRIIYAMQDQGMTASSKFHKCAAVVGEVLKKYHPHGDVAVYESLVRMGQDFSLRYPLIVPQGNFGCFTKDTKVKLADGRDLSFEDLVKEDLQGKTNYTYTINSAGLIAIAEIKKPRITRSNAELVKVTLDNGTEIRCTPNHKFMLREGLYKEAKDLHAGESLMPLYLRLSTNEDRINRNGYLLAFQNKENEWVPVHHLADNFNLTNKKYNKSKGKVRHHLNFNKLDNNPDNIIRMKWGEHWKIHYEQASEQHKNPNYREKISKGREAFWSDDANKEKYRIRLSKRNKINWQNPKYREKMSKVLSEINKEYQKNHPELKEILSKRVKQTLKKLWQDPKYRQRKSEQMSEWNKEHRGEFPNNSGKHKFLAICRSILSAHFTPNAQTYEQKRRELYRYDNFGGSTNWENGVKKYFQNDPNLILWELNKNHKVISVEALTTREDVYDLTIENSHNFALAAGIFVHNSIDGDPPAAMRYTESKLSPIAEELYRDIHSNTVNFELNDLQNYEPVFLPSLLPNLLLNGSSGIAVGMATNIPPHNLSELIDGINLLIEKAENIGTAPKKDDEKQIAETDFSSSATVEDLVEYIKGPDFPTGSTIYDQKEIIQAYATGRGKIVTRAKMEIEEAKGGKIKIIVTEIPYQVNKSTLISKIADLVKDKKIDGIYDLRDESNREGMRIVIEVKRDAVPKKVQNQLYKYTPLQSTFNANMVALLDNEPKLMTLKFILEEFVKHRQRVVVRRTIFLLDKATAREHILLGLKIALDHLDEVIKLIRGSKDADAAKEGLIKAFKFTEIQAQAILDMQLRRLAALERKKIEDELKEVRETIQDLQGILASPKRIIEIVQQELTDIKEKYGDERKTKVIKGKVGELSDEDLVTEENCIITISKSGYIKRLKEDTYRKQGRGGKGVTGQTLKEEDEIDTIKICNTHDYAFFFTNKGRVYKLRIWEIPESSRIAKGTALVNFLNIGGEEKVESFLTLRTDTLEKGEGYVIFGTQKGNVKKTSLEEYANIRSSGIAAIKLEENDNLIKAEYTTGEDEILLTTSHGQSIRFKEKDVRPMGRSAAGVTGIKLSKKEDRVVGMVIIRKSSKNCDLVVVTANGYGKKTKVDEYKVQNRAGSGILTYKITDKTGKLIYAESQEKDQGADVLMATCSGKVIRLSDKQIPRLGRATQGVRLMRLDDKDYMTSVTFLREDEVEIEES